MDAVDEDLYFNGVPYAPLAQVKMAVVDGEFTTFNTDDREHYSNIDIGDQVNFKYIGDDKGSMRRSLGNLRSVFILRHGRYEFRSRGCQPR